MMIVLLLLGTCVSLGLSDDSYIEYGKTYRLKLHRDAHSLQYRPKYNPNVTISWKLHEKRGEGRYYGMLWGFYELRNLTQENSGCYTLRDKDQKLLSTKTIEVIANRRSYERHPGESLSFTFDLEPNSCNIYFFSKRDLKRKGVETELVRQGRLQRNGLDEVNCIGYQLSKLCGILIKNLQMSCGGRFEVRDHNGNKALVVSLKMNRRVEKPSGVQPHNNYYPGIAAVFFLVSGCCGCMNACCNGDSSSEPAPEYDHEPVGPRPDEPSQPSGTYYSAQPSSTLTGPLVHNANDDVPPAYSEVVASAEQENAPTISIYSEPSSRG